MAPRTAHWLPILAQGHTPTPAPTTPATATQPSLSDQLREATAAREQGWRAARLAEAQVGLADALAAASCVRTWWTHPAGCPDLFYQASDAQLFTCPIPLLRAGQ